MVDPAVNEIILVIVIVIWLVLVTQQVIVGIIHIHIQIRNGRRMPVIEVDIGIASFIFFRGRAQLIHGQPSHCFHVESWTGSGCRIPGYPEEYLPVRPASHCYSQRNRRPPERCVACL